MSDEVRCATHGLQDATHVCRHIMDSIDTRKAVGFHSPPDTDRVRLDAWCTQCEQPRLSEGGDWTDAAMKFIDVSVLCDGCYDRAEAVWLRSGTS